MVGAAMATSVAILIGAVAASLFFQMKSQELAEGNQKLSIALAQAEKANQLGLESLRQMFTNVVVTKFRQKAALSDQEYRFLEAALEQYRAMASIQSGSERGQAIRAESHYRMASILEQLSKEEESVEHFSKALDNYEELAKRTDRAEYWKGWVDSLRSLSSLQIVRGEVEDALIHARKGNELLETTRSLIDAPHSFYRLYHQAVFHAIQGSCLAETSGDHRAAVEGQRKAIQLLEQCLQENPEESLQVLDQLSHCNMALSNALGELPAEEDIPTQQLVAATHATCYAHQLYGVLPNEPHAMAQYVEASLARCEALLRCESIRGALDEVRRAIPLAQKLVDRFPLYESFSYNLSRSLVLEAELSSREEEWGSAERALQRTVELPIKIRELNRSIAILGDLRRQAPESLSLRLLLSRFYSLRASYYEKYSRDWVAARADVSEALPLIASLENDPEWRDRCLMQRFTSFLQLSRVCTAFHDGIGAKQALEDAETTLKQIAKTQPEKANALQTNLDAHRNQAGSRTENGKAEVDQGELP